MPKLWQATTHGKQNFDHIAVSYGYKGCMAAGLKAKKLQQATHLVMNQTIVVLGQPCVPCLLLWQTMIVNQTPS